MRSYLSFSLLMGLFFLTTTALQAQVGFKLGVNYASLSRDPGEATIGDYKEKSVIGLQGGLVLEFALADMFAIQPEFLYIQKGGKYQAVVDENNKLITKVLYDYIEVPVLAKLKLGNTDGEGLGFYLIGGPFAGLALKGKGETELTVLGVTTTDEFEVDYKDDDNREKRLDWGVSFGAGLNFGHLFIDARYNLGVNNLLDDDANNNNDNSDYLRTRGIGLTLGLMF